jgi:hypothetical protein
MNDFFLFILGTLGDKSISSGFRRGPSRPHGDPETSLGHQLLSLVESHSWWRMNMAHISATVCVLF